MPSLINPRGRNFIRNFIDAKGLLSEPTARFTLHGYTSTSARFRRFVRSMFAPRSLPETSVSIRERVPGGSMKCTSDKRASRRWGSVSNANVENAIIDGFTLEKKEKKERTSLFWSGLKWKGQRVPENGVWNFYYTVHVHLDSSRFR